MGRASILLVEDEVLIRMMLAQMVEELGHRVIAEAGSVQVGRRLAEAEQFDLAMLDINLQGVSIEPVAEVLVERGIPFFFISGYGRAGLPHRYGALILPKPCLITQLREAIDATLGNNAKAPDQT